VWTDADVSVHKMERKQRVVLRSIVFDKSNEARVRVSIECGECDSLDDENEERQCDTEIKYLDYDSDPETVQIHPTPTSKKTEARTYPVEIQTAENDGYSSDSDSVSSVSSSSSLASSSSFSSCVGGTSNAAKINLQSIQSRLALIEASLVTTLCKTQRRLRNLKALPTLTTPSVPERD
jgi:hypothetical protein